MTNYKEIIQVLPALLENISYDITILANTCALLYEKMEGINWVGFYLFRNNQLELGPFQGKIACSIIPLYKGVCGTCAATKRPIIVEDVHQFKGHIACDSASQSEICIPILLNDQFYGLLDIDAPTKSHFTEQDKNYLTKIVEIITHQLKNI